MQSHGSAETNASEISGGALKSGMYALCWGVVVCHWPHRDLHY